MATTTLAAARALLFAALNVNAVTSLDAVTGVFDYEPDPAETAEPGIVTIFASGITPDFFLFSIRCYYVGDYGEEAAQRNLDAMIEAVQTALSTTGVGNIGPSQWTIGWGDNIRALVAQSDVQIGREDYP